MEALAAVPVSTLCDVDKSLPVVDPAIRPLTSARLCGPAFTVVAAGEFLSVLYAIGEAAPGGVLVLQAGGAPPAAPRGRRSASCWPGKRGGAGSAGSSSTATSATAPGSRTCRCGRAGPCRWPA